LGLELGRKPSACLHAGSSFPSGDPPYAPVSETGTTSRVENGKRTNHHYTGDIEAEINRLKADGFTVREIPMDGAPSLRPQSRGSCVKRKLFSERFGNFAKVKP